MLTFDEETHRYYWNGNEVPGVTTVLGEWVQADIYGGSYYVNVFTGKAVAAQMFKDGADHGNAVHLAIKYHLTCGLDMGALDPTVKAAVDQFDLWRHEHVDEILVVEEPLYSLKYGYAGTLDLGVVFKKTYGGGRGLVDVKTGAHGLSGPQTSAYEQLWREADKYRGGIGRHILELPKAGNSYRFIPEARRDDFSFFINRLSTYNYIKRR